jgi:hypothetical protein
MLREDENAGERPCGRTRIRENTENPRILDVNNIIVVLPSKSERMLRQDDNVRKRVDENAGGRECGWTRMRVDENAGRRECGGTREH